MFKLTHFKSVVPFMGHRQTAERGVPSGAILFVSNNFIEKLNKN